MCGVQLVALHANRVTSRTSRVEDGRVVRAEDKAIAASVREVLCERGVPIDVVPVKKIP